MEKLCRLKPLLAGLSPAVLSDLQWPEIGEAAHCQCWRTLLTELKPGHRAMLYNAVQEVMVLLSVFSTTLITSLIFSFLLITSCGSHCSRIMCWLTQWRWTGSFFTLTDKTSGKISHLVKPKNWVTLVLLIQALWVSIIASAHFTCRNLLCVAFTGKFCHLLC